MSKGSLTTALAVALAALMLGLGGAGAAAQTGQSTQAIPASQPAEALQRGPETGLPLPRYVSLKTSEGRARRGPNRGHRVDWLFTRRDMPLLVTAEFEHWRRVEDHDGEGGWMHYSLLSGVRTALVMQDMAVMRSQPHEGASEVALLERGVIARILACEEAWCRLRVDHWRGWVPRTALWGVDPGETLN